GIRDFHVTGVQTCALPISRLAAAMDARGPLCVGIDPHPGLLRAWGLEVSAAGVERFALTAVDALADRVAVLKPQSAFFEVFGSRSEERRVGKSGAIAARRS